LLNKSDVNQDSQIDKNEMENLVITLNYALESAKIKKSLDDVKARNKVFSQSSGLSI
jgi:Ca2+-binding EF-hand superfamily protein